MEAQFYNGCAEIKPSLVILPLTPKSYHTTGSYANRIVGMTGRLALPVDGKIHCSEPAQNDGLFFQNAGMNKPISERSTRSRFGTMV